MNTNKRTDDEINRIIAEWCGWKWEPHTYGTCLRDPSGAIVNNNYAEVWRLPNYCRDLNAVRDAESKLSDDQQFQLIRVLTGLDESFDRLHKIDPKRFPKRETWIEDYMHRLGWDQVWAFCLQATARQRAEALVKVIEEGEK